LRDLQARLPTVPCTFADLIMLAELAYWWAPKGANGKMLALACGGKPNEHFAARLIDAVLTMAGPLASRSITSASIDRKPAGPQPRRLRAAYCPLPVAPVGDVVAGGGPTLAKGLE
jgi:hypothetical protein